MNGKLKNYITIDGSEAKVNISLVQNNKIIKNLKLNRGPKYSRADFQFQLSKAIENLLSATKLSYTDIIAIIASGMITSEYGLYELKHIKAPAGIKELNCSMRKVNLPEISPIPFYFIPGIMLKSNSFISTDIMRGEETKIFGILKANIQNNAFLIADSHSKLILLDEKNRISSFKTMLTGEMLSSLSLNTILSDSMKTNFTDFDPEYLLLGYDACLKYGLNEAIFKTRICKNIFQKSDFQCYSYYLGVILFEDVKAVISSNIKKLIIGGKSTFKNPLSFIFEKRTDIQSIPLSDTETDICSSIGAIKIFEYEQ